MLTDRLLVAALVAFAARSAGSAQTPVIRRGGVVNAASLAPATGTSSRVAAGSIASIFASSGESVGNWGLSAGGS